LQGFPISYFDNFLPLLEHSFEARLILGELCLRALGRTCAFARACLVLLRAAWRVSSTSKSFGKKLGFGMLWPLTAANLKIYPAGAQNFSPSLQHTPNIHHLFGLLSDQSVTRGAFGKIFRIV